MVKTFDILLDIEKELYNPSSLLFTVSRDDFNTIQLNFAISQDGKVVDLTNKIVELAIKKPSGLTVYQDCEITNALQGLAQTYLSQQAYIEYGVYMAEVYVREGTEISVTSPFWYQAKSSIFNAYGVGSIDDLSALQKALFAYDLKPVIVENFPTITPEYVGQMAFDSVNEIAYIATDLSSADWQTFGTGEGGGGGNDTILGNGVPTVTPARWGQLYVDSINKNAYISIGATAEDWEQIDNEEFIKHAVTWGEILEKPTTFAPEEHGHEIIEVIGLQDALDSKATFFHTHDWTEINNKPLTFEPSEHLHEVGEINGLQASLDSKADDSDLTAKANIADVYTKLETYNKTEVDDIVTGITEGGGTVVEDNLISNSTSSALSANQGRILNETKADINHTHDYAPETHTHLVSEIEGLQTELDGKADIVHTHVKADIIDFAHTHDWDEVTGKPTTFAPEAHNHEIAEINGLQASLDLKADDTDLAGKADINHNHDTVYLSKTGGEITDRLIINNKGDGKEQIRFDIDRAWSFKQIGLDVSSQLALIPDANNKTFSIMSPLGVKTLEVRVSDIPEDGYINAHVIEENGVKLVDKFALKSAIWTGTQTDYDAIATKDATTLYFITG